MSSMTDDEYERLPPRKTWNPLDPIEEYARFQRKGYALEIFVVSASTVCLEPAFEDTNGILVSEESGLPFPRLKHFVQSALDSGLSSLADDLVDGMNLTEEWGAKVGLHFGQVTLRNGNVSDQQKFWIWLICSKQKRMGIYYDPKVYASKYRMHREGDLTALLDT